jgi:hypothetical protein
MGAQTTRQERTNRAIRVGLRAGFAVGAVIGVAAALGSSISSAASPSINEILGAVLPLLLIAAVLALGTGAAAGLLCAALAAVAVRAAEQRPVRVWMILGAVLGAAVVVHEFSPTTGWPLLIGGLTIGAALGGSVGVWLDPHWQDAPPRPPM